MRTGIRLTTVAALCALQVGCSTPDSDYSALAPIVAAAPNGIAGVLVNDSIVEVQMPGAAFSRAVEVNGCRTLLRDPSTQERFQLVQVGEATEPQPASGIRLEANYNSTDSPTALPANSYLRVACGTNKVVGLADARRSGT